MPGIQRLQMNVRGLLLITACSAIMVWLASPFYQEHRVEKKLRSNVTVNFSDAPLTNILSILSEDADVRITVDPAGLAKENVDPSMAVTMVLSQPISLKSTLTLLLDPLRLSYFRQGNHLIVTSLDTADVEKHYVSPEWCGFQESARRNRR